MHGSNFSDDRKKVTKQTRSRRIFFKFPQNYAIRTLLQIDLRALTDNKKLLANYDGLKYTRALADTMVTAISTFYC
jgi:hypothetical protein